MAAFEGETEATRTVRPEYRARTSAPAEVLRGADVTRDAIVREHQQLAMVLRVSQAAASLDLDELIEQVGICLQTVEWRWDYTALLLHEPSRKSLSQHSLFARPELMADVRKYNGALVPIEGSQSGRAFSTGEPSVVNTRAEYEALISPTWGAEALKYIPPAYSSCVVPLVWRGRCLGTLVSASVREGAFDAEAVQFLCRIANAIAPAVDNALAYRQIDELKDCLSKEKTHLESEITATLGEIVGTSPALRQVLSLVQSVAGTDSTVLIQGETGTGKELVARAVHHMSHRRAATFVKINCAAIPTGLLESELFGHEKGAFTGAVSQKAGRFELADGGTLFLDEVAEIPTEVQPKLLRVLQEQEFERLGSTRTIKVDVRLIAATNRDLGEMVSTRAFRSDLFYRLNVFPIAVPPLRDRREDIPRLVRHFVDRCARRLRKMVTVVSQETLDAMSSYDWPGNVRELENVVERSVILSTGPELFVPASALEMGGRSGGAPSSGVLEVAARAPQTLAEADRDFIVRALEGTNWVVSGRSGAAARLGLSRTTLQARMRKLGISRPMRNEG